MGSNINEHAPPQPHIATVLAYRLVALGRPRDQVDAPTGADDLQEVGAELIALNESTEPFVMWV